MYFIDLPDVIPWVQGRRTLDYRLKNEEITGKSLGDLYDRLTLQRGGIVGSEIFPNDLRK